MPCGDTQKSPVSTTPGSQALVPAAPTSSQSARDRRQGALAHAGSAAPPPGNRRLGRRVMSRRFSQTNGFRGERWAPPPSAELLVRLSLGERVRPAAAASGCRSPGPGPGPAEAQVGQAGARGCGAGGHRGGSRCSPRRGRALGAGTAARRARGAAAGAAASSGEPSARPGSEVVRPAAPWARSRVTRARPPRVGCVRGAELGVYPCR